MSSSLHAFAARLFIVVASMYTACLQLFSESSLAFRAAGDSWLIDAINWAVIGLAGLAGADLLWRDILRRGLIWPIFDAHLRHHICVATYSGLAGAFAVRAFLAVGSDKSAVAQVGIYYVLIAIGIAIEAAATAHEERQ